jgi:hypothetical protein
MVRSRALIAREQEHMNAEEWVTKVVEKHGEALEFAPATVYEMQADHESGAFERGPDGAVVFASQPSADKGRFPVAVHDLDDRMTVDDDTAERTFRAEQLACTESGDSFVHILEPGLYQGFVFWNGHDEGLYSIEDLEDYDDLDEDAPVQERIEQMPFFENLVAKSLDEFYGALRPAG